MLTRNILFYLLFLHLINGQLQINLYLTDWISNKENKNGLLHNCLYATTNPHTQDREPYQIIPYCMGEWPSKWDIQQNNIDEKFTFTELAEQSITSEQLYLWSAPIDIIESYQFYLNQQINSKTPSISKSIYYNCTLPNFGPKCQYALHDYKSHQSSLDQIVYEFYEYNVYLPTLLTCYIHLQCYRGPSPSCLDWTEICDGKVDCLDGEEDEKDCWQIEIHECDENEFRCLDGQCIPLAFLRETEFHSDCLDQSDQSSFGSLLRPFHSSFPNEPSFGYEDISCVKLSNSYFTSIASSCVRQREELLSQAMFSIKPKTISNECWTAFKCIIHVPIPFDKLCKKLCLDGTCDEIVRNNCPDIVYAPAEPVLLGHVFLAYETNTLNYTQSSGSKPTYFCYDDQRLHLPNNIEKLVLFDNTTCRSYNDSILDQDDRKTKWIERYANPLYKWLKMWISQIYNDSIHCNKSIMHQCVDSYKCISKDRLYDGIQDCFHKEDEDMSQVDKNCSTKQNLNHYKCETTNECVSHRFVNDGTCQCTIHTEQFGLYCDDEYFDNRNMRNEISFLIICDGFTHLFPKMIDNENHTDETECDQWSCNNIYTRCNKFWNCPNGVDELNCDLSPMMQCPPNHHICGSVETKKMMCLSIEKANDGNVDCIGATDEPALCRMKEHHKKNRMSFYCHNETHSFCERAGTICDGRAQCPKADDEQMCNEIGIYELESASCFMSYNTDNSRAADVFCKPFFAVAGDFFNAIYFKLRENVQNSLEANVAHDENSNVLSRQSTLSQIENFYQQRCHRGLDLQVWLDKEKNLTTKTCLCPPSFYGDTCQYQNQRVSITIRVHVQSDSTEIPIVLINSLIDDTEQRTIQSYEQFTYLSKRKNCQRKLNFYLLYSMRPKNETTNYFVRIDMYERSPVKYRGSIIKPILFSFLPVYRLAFEVNIPSMYSNIESCSDRQCINGQCRRYFNDLNNTFCHCHEGWSGQYCTIKHNCTCSSDSTCVGILPNNQSICVCPLNKMGTQCLINNTFLCEINSNETCLNGGQCIVIDEHRTIYQQIICICQKGFTGDRCEIVQSKIVLSFDNNITLSSSMHIHFIEVDDQKKLTTLHTTHYKAIPYGQRSVTIYWADPFHLVFIELTNNYYLAALQKYYSKSVIIEKTLYPSDRCINITEFFNETILNYHLLRRIKHYHLPCRSNLSQRIECFYDDIHLCVCQDLNHERMANCFEFDHHMKRNCDDKNGCENEGDCFQDSSECPTTSICVCPTCFYGSQCQMNSNGFSLSLDAILGYHIRPNINIAHQPISIIISLILTVIITFLGLINGILTLITFKNKITRESGCGIYLLCSSIITLLTMIVFLLKFLILLLSHMGLIKNRLFLNVQCYSIDFILRVCLTMDQWLTACVAIERAYIIIKGTSFNTKKTIVIAKWTIFILLCIMAGTAIHDSIYRDLFEEKIDEEKRIWCYVKYSSVIQTFNIIMNIFHFVIPFIINIISALIIIILNTRQRAKIQTQKNYREILIEQIEQHKNLLIGPLVLIILGIPRLIISHTSGCMKSPSDAWLFLFGYFISLIPPTLTFILFVLPSGTYKKAFLRAISEYRNRFRRGS